ncbi:heterokaryon incompatibility protein-domain-containing protein [Podospora aff. communis PSN243]|uniref:Heterokaryon incompatibility protein-domain-containing protein n=1 Tax=Podospora aff. communis PSN243 TaxID=3040156 RepID=A0AAV9H3Y1_9PEZI|nr:heterokaryon incompatibility protein-domain-containing protein [Podospora aff. communis PSN243]
MASRPKRRVRTEDTTPAQLAKRSRRKLPANAATNPPPELCGDCQQIDLAEAFTNADKYFDANWDLILGLREWRDREDRDAFAGLPVADLGQRIAQRDPTANCRRCSFLWDARMTKHRDRPDSDTRYELRAFPCYWALPFIRNSARMIPTKHRRNQPSVFAVVPSPLEQPSLVRQELFKSAIFRTSSVNPNHVTAKPIAPFVDFESIKEWMTFCSDHHSKGCPKSGLSEVAPVTVQVSGFRLIDCQNGVVVPATVDWDFAALSYIWGPTEEASGSTTCTDSSTPWPLTVQDAMRVRMQLGLRYLWVDRYCIDHNNADEKHDQIAKMDVIYRQSQVTIIVAAGDRATLGIPGVSKPRCAVPTFSNQGLELTMVPEDPHDSIRASKWWKRGWTYQEGVLLQRRIVFTECSVYYECGGMVAYDAYALPPGRLHTNTYHRQERFVRGGIFSGNIGEETEGSNPFTTTSSLRHNARLGRALGHLMNYCHRELSYNSDMLNAFRGILSAHGLETTFGLLLGTPHQRRDQVGKKTVRKLDFNQGALLAALVGWWHVDGHATRITEFPSWSWAGWRGNLETYTPADYLDGHYERYPEDSPELEIHYEQQQARDVGFVASSSWRCVAVSHSPPRGPELLFVKYVKLDYVYRTYDRPLSEITTLGDVKAGLEIRLDLSYPVRDDARLGLDIDFLYVRRADNYFFRVFLVVKYLKDAGDKEGAKNETSSICERIGVAHIDVRANRSALNPKHERSYQDVCRVVSRPLTIR